MSAFPGWTLKSYLNFAGCQGSRQIGQTWSEKGEVVNQVYNDENDILAVTWAVMVCMYWALPHNSSLPADDFYCIKQVQLRDQNLGKIFWACHQLQFPVPPLRADL